MCFASSKSGHGIVAQTLVRRVELPPTCPLCRDAAIPAPSIPPRSTVVIDEDGVDRRTGNGGQGSMREPFTSAGLPVPNHPEPLSVSCALVTRRSRGGPRVAVSRLLAHTLCCDQG